jgi:hypothetical protein
MADRSFERRATVTAALYRAPAMSGSPPTRGAPVLINAAVACTPFDPISPVVDLAAGFAAPFELKQTYTETEVREGDILLLNGEKYTVGAVAEWDWAPGVVLYELQLRQPKAS